MSNAIHDKIEAAILKRASFIQAPYNTAFRLLNGFQEGIPDIIIDVFATTVVFHDYTDNDNLVNQILTAIHKFLPWITAGVVKKRRSERVNEQAGRLIFGHSFATKILENGVQYALRLTMNQDASFYLDTRNLREWLNSEMSGKRVLNTFAYTGSLGIAALTGGASEVIQLDLNRQFLSLAMKSAKLNEFPVVDAHYQTADFWSRINQYKTSGKMFDCVILDPPVYSKTSKGIIDVAKNYPRLINKVRPIIVDGGYLITINNALFQSGKTHQNELEAICKDGYVSIERIISVPDDCAFQIEGSHRGATSDPAPYNSSTKITILRIKRKKSPSTVD